MYWRVAFCDNKIDTFYKDNYRGSYRLLKEPFCKICSSPIRNEQQSNCSWTAAHPTFIKRIYAIGNYIPIDSYHKVGQSDFLSGHIYYSKYNIFRGEPLGLAIAECIKQKYVELLSYDFLVSIPRFSTEYHCDEDTGEPFNPPDILVRWINKQLNIPIIEPLEKTRAQKMKGLNTPERRQAVRGLYRCISSDLKDKSIILVDDVSTSGSTMDECARMLLNAGAKSVCGFVSGRNDPD